MTSQMNSSFALKFVFAIAVIGMVAVAGSVGAGNGENKFDISTITSAVDVSSLPVLHIADPI